MSLSKYYPIDEELARRAKEMMSFSDYVPGSATGTLYRVGTQGRVNTIHLASVFTEIWVNLLHPAGGENLPKSTIYGCFFFKASHAQELMEDKTAQPIQVEVVKILQLTGQQFRDFSANLLRDMPFLIPNKHLTGYDKGVTRCLLVTTRSRRDGILVDCQGYNFARYSCYVPEKRSLDLRDVPVEHYDLKLRQPRSQRER